MNIDNDSFNYPQQLSYLPRTPPEDFICPILRTLMMDPVLSIQTGLNYEHSAILGMKILGNDLCPITRKPFGTVIANCNLQDEIIGWIQRRSHTSRTRRRLRRLRRHYLQQHNSQVQQERERIRIAPSVAEPSTSQPITSQQDQRATRNDAVVLECVRAHSKHNVEVDAQKLYSNASANPDSLRATLHTRHSVVLPSAQQHECIFRRGPTLYGL